MHPKVLGEWDGIGNKPCADAGGYNLKAFLMGQAGTSAATDL